MNHSDGAGVGASFRGVPFRTTDSDTGVGRRNELHEYPLRDVPFADDLGRRARQFQITGYVLGEDYLQQRDALIAALEAYGPGELIHPRYGMLNVVVIGQVSIRESSAEGGVARFSITFAEAGENTFPQEASSTQGLVHDAADGLGLVSIDRLASLLDVSGAAVLATDVIGRVTSALDALQRMVSLNGLVEAAGDIVRGISSISSRVSALIRTPETLALQMQSLYQQLNLALRRPKSALADLRAEFGANDPAPWVTPGVASSVPPGGEGGEGGAAQRRGTTAAQRQVNLAVVQEFVRAQVVAAQARILSDAIGAGDIVTSQDAQEQAAVVLDEIDHELEAYDPPAEVAAALIALRVAIVRDVSEQADRLLQRSTITTQAVLPALLIAQRVYQDATRADEIVTRNGVLNPLFVPARELEVLR
ncbi:DNA circularization protein [Bordetella ansorpii]|uniref:DNA circularization protein n=1 Tax=Bordetella ansorpii TaxID=288768 RepID=UPI0018D3B245|nr:DNA circularization N-terminal domain-containing protein [Bordetella ansorpii]